MKEKLERKKVFDEEGVTEVFGDFLILVITMTLFTGVFLMVWSMPTPDSGVHADFIPGIDLNGDGGEINVTHSGGETLKGEHTAVYLFRNEIEEVRTLGTQGKDEDNEFYGIPGDPHWDPGETWTYFYGGLAGGDNLMMSIIDMRSNELIMKADLLSGSYNAPPIIMERWYAPNPAVNGTEVSIYANVMDPNGQFDIDSVSFNASCLNSELEFMAMEDSDNDGTYEAQVTITEGPGEWEIVLSATDIAEASDRARMKMTVKEAYEPIIEYLVISPNSVEVAEAFTIRAVIIDLNCDLNLSQVTVTTEAEFYEKGGLLETSLELEEEVPYGGIFALEGEAPNCEGSFELTLSAEDEMGFTGSKVVSLSVIQDAQGGNGSYNDSIWAYLGPESLDFKHFYYTVDNPPDESSTYHIAVYIEEEHIGSDCYLHVNIINHYYEDVYIDGNSGIRLLQIGGAASNKDIDIVQNGTDFGEPVGTAPDGTWYKIPAPEDGDYFHGGEPVSLAFGPFDMQSANEGDVFGSIL
ncbi:MAG: type IV pilin N-terminal domain-containing protein, partial [Thermoplasmata archaeon]